MNLRGKRQNTVNRRKCFKNQQLIYQRHKMKQHNGIRERCHLKVIIRVKER